jgi:hypothetical protein
MEHRLQQPRHIWSFRSSSISPGPTVMPPSRGTSVARGAGVLLPRKRHNEPLAYSAPLTIVVLHSNPASDACAAAAQWRRLVGIIIATSMDHDRMPLNVSYRQVWCHNGLRGLAASIDGHHR